MNPKQYQKYLRVYKEKEQNRLKEVDLLNHALGKYIWYAFNKPKDYPNNSFTSTYKELIPMSDEEMERQAKRNTIKLGGNINDS